jgi:hypothetical protein
MADNNGRHFNFDKSINLGHILILVGLVTSAVAVYTSASIMLNSHAYRLSSLESQVKVQWERANQVDGELYKLKESQSILRVQVDGLGKRP